jgi:hypothetical protein
LRLKTCFDVNVNSEIAKQLLGSKNQLRHIYSICSLNLSKQKRRREKAKERRKSREFFILIKQFMLNILSLLCHLRHIVTVQQFHVLARCHRRRFKSSLTLRRKRTLPSLTVLGYRVLPGEQHCGKENLMGLVVVMKASRLQ